MMMGVPEGQLVAARDSRGPLRGCRRGAAAAEFALVLPLLLMMMFGGLQYGSLFFAQNSLQTAARNGARALASGAVSAGDVQTAVRGDLPGWIAPGDVVVNAGPLGADQVRVRISVPAARAAVVRLVPMPETIEASVVMQQETLGVGS